MSGLQVCRPHHLGQLIATWLPAAEALSWSTINPA